MSAKAEMLNKTFGRLFVIKENGRLGQHLSYFCQCSCGNQVTVRGNSLRSGNTTSCGCVHKSMIGKLNFKHGLKRGREYSSWQMMIDRCTNKNSKSWNSYGGRGITVCDRWKDFSKFYQDMGERPENHTLERIDNNLGYSLENCKWATVKEQNRNTRRTRLLEINGVTKCVTDWCDYFGINKRTVSNRINRGKWPVELAITTPVNQYSRAR
jgi:hypothetical protein